MAVAWWHIAEAITQGGKLRVHGHRGGQNPGDLRIVQIVGLRRFLGNVHDLVLNQQTETRLCRDSSSEILLAKRGGQIKLAKLHTSPPSEATYSTPQR